jgi:hypothetical protein
VRANWDQELTLEWQGKKKWQRALQHTASQGHNNDKKD